MKIENIFYLFLKQNNYSKTIILTNKMIKTKYNDK